MTNRYANSAASSRPSFRASRRMRDFEGLFRECYSEVYNFVFYPMLDEQAAEDVVAESFLRAARYFDRYDPSRAKFSTWVKSIARNCMNDYYRKHPKTITIEDVSEAALVSGDDFVKHTENADMAKRLLSLLKEDERELVRMKYFDGLRNVDIAQQLGLNESTVASRIQRALAKMSIAAGAKAV